MDKLKMAHDWALVFTQHNKDLSVASKTVSAWAFDYADAMQAEADKRISKERPDVLCEVDWRVAPQDTKGWKIKEGRAYWIDSDGWIIEDAPSFGFTGSHIMEHPHGF